MIPEFVGRIPVVATLSELDEDALVQILTKPKNAITKQYQILLEFENVKLTFTPDALRLIAKQSLAKGIGARGLRTIIENAMLDVMYEIPSQSDIKEVIINDAVIARRDKPLLVYEHEAKTA